MNPPINQQINLTGTNASAQSAIKGTAASLGQLEDKATSVAGKVGGLAAGLGRFLGGVASTTAKLTAAAGGGAALAAKGLTGIGAASGLVSGALLKVNAVAATLASTFGAFIGDSLQLVQTTKTAKEFGKTWSGIADQLKAPFVYFLIDAFKQLNAVLKDPAVKQLVKELAAVLTVVFRQASAALKVFLDGFRQFAALLNKGDLIGAIRSLGDTLFKTLDTLTGGALTWGRNLVANIANGIIDGARQFITAAANYVGSILANFLQPHSPPKEGPLSTINRWGAALINLFLSGFRHADFSALNEIAGTIQERLQTLVDRINDPGARTKAQIGLIPQLIGSQAAIAGAISEMHRIGGLSDSIIARVRGQLAGLGSSTQDYVENMLRALDATRKVEEATGRLKTAQDGVKAASSALANSQEALAAIQREQDQIQRRQADRTATEILPLQDRLRSLQRDLNLLLQKQEPDRERLRQLTEDQATAEAEVNRLEKEQAARLKSELLPLQDRLNAAVAAQKTAEAAVLAAQDALIAPMAALAAAQENLNALQATAQANAAQWADQIAAAQEQLDAAQTTAADHAKVYQDQIAAVEDDRDAALAKEQTGLDAVNAKYKTQLDAQQAIIDAVEQKYKAEVDGATAAYNAANKLATLEDRHNRRQLLIFAQQRDAAMAIRDPNKRIAELARINRAEAGFSRTEQTRLDRLHLEAQVRQDQLDTVNEQKDAEESGATTQLANLQAALDAERAVIQARIDSITKESDLRIKALQEEAKRQAAIDQDAIDAASDRVKQLQKAADAQAKADAGTIKAAEAQVKAAQAVVDARQKDLESAQRAAELAGRAVQAAQDELAARDKAIHDETDGAIETARTRAESLADQAKALQDRLDKEQQGTRDAIEATQLEMDIRQSRLDDLAERENAIINARLQAAQDDVDAAANRVTAAQKIADAAQAEVDQAAALVDQYNAAAELAKDRIDAEAQIAKWLAEERDLLAQQDKKDKGPAGPKGPKTPGLPAPPPDPGPILAPWVKAWGDAVGRVRELLDTLGKFFDDLFHGRFGAAALDLQKFGDLAGKIIKDLFGPDVLAAVRLITDPIGNYVIQVLKLAQNLKDGMPVFEAFRTFLTNIGVPEPVAKALAALGDAMQQGLAPGLRIITEELGPAFQKFLDNANISLPPLGDVFGLLAEILGGVLATALGLVIGLFGGLAGLVSGVLPGLGLAVHGIIEFFTGIWDIIAGLGVAIAGIIELLQGLVTAMLGGTANMDQAWKDLGDGLTSIIAGILGLFGGLVDTIIGLIGALVGGVIGLISGFVESVVNYFSTLADDLVGHSIIPDMVAAILSFFTTLKDQAIELVSGLWSAVTGAFNTARDTVVSTVSGLWSAVTGAFNTARDTVVSTVSDLKDKAVALFSGARDLAVSVWNDLNSKVIAAVNDLNSKIVGAVTDINNKVIEMFNSARDGAVSAWSTARDTVTNAANAVRDNIASAITTARDTATNLFNTARDNAVSAWNDLRDKATGAVTTLRDNLIGPGGIIPTLVSGISGAIGSVPGLFIGPDGIVTRIGSAITGEIAQLQSIGGNLVGGLVKGIQDNWHLVLDKIKQLAEGLPQPIKDVLGIQSPAEATQDVSYNILQGLIVGVTDNTEAVLAAFRSLADQILAELNLLATNGAAAVQTGMGLLMEETAAGLAAFLALWEPALAQLAPLIDRVFGGWADHEGDPYNLLWMIFVKPFGFFTHIADATSTFLANLYFAAWEPQLGALSTRVQGKFSEMGDTLGAAAESLGEKIAQGIAAGIQAQIEAVASAAAAVVEAAIAAANAAAGNPHSPAPALIPLGRALAQAVAYGMDQLRSLAYSSGRGLVQAARAGVLAGGFGSVTAPRATATSLSPALAGAGAGGASGAFAPVHYHAGTVNVYTDGGTATAQEEAWMGMITR
jgi:phage-related protein